MSLIYRSIQNLDNAQRKDQTIDELVAQGEQDVQEWKQKRNQEIERLARLHELKEQGLITFEKLSLKDAHELLNNLEILGM